MPEHESMTINGRLILKIGRNSCRGCGRSIEVFRHLHDERNDGLGDQRHHGRTVLWASPPECPGCDVQGQLARRHNPPRWGRLQRGIRREAVAAEAEKLVASGNAVAGVAASALQEILDSFPAPRIALAAFEDHPMRDLMGCE